MILYPIEALRTCVTVTVSVVLVVVATVVL